MMWTLFRVVGIPLLIAVGIFFGGKYLYDSGKAEKEQEIIIEQQEEYIDTTKRIQDVVKRNRNTNADDAREWLRQRQSN